MQVNALQGQIVLRQSGRPELFRALAEFCERDTLCFREVEPVGLPAFVAAAAGLAVAAVAFPGKGGVWMVRVIATKTALNILVCVDGMTQSFTCSSVSVSPAPLAST